MKRVIFFLLLAVSFSAKAQTLKELLYSGKLKNDSNTVIRKTDDLSTKIDTSTKKKPEPVQTTVVAAPVVDTVKITNPQTGAVTTTTVAVKDPAKTSTTNTTETGVVATPPVEAPLVAAPAAAAPPKTTTKIWKEYTDSLVKVLQAEVMSNKKIKKETYFITADYDLDVDGKVTVTNVICNPENGILNAAVTDRMQTAPPQLAPVPKKIKRKVNFTITKD
jgi:hypothetical protein